MKQLFIGRVLLVVVASAFVHSGQSRTAGTLPSATCCGCTDVCISSCQDRPRALTFLYNGGTCEQSDNDQPSSFFRCIDLMGGPPVLPDEASYIVATDIYGRMQKFFEGTVKVGETFTLNGIDGDLLDYNVNLTIYDNSSSTVNNENNNILQTTVYHTSCSQGLDLDDSFGSAQLKSFVNDVQGETSCMYIPIDDNDSTCCGCDECVSRCDHPPKNLTFLYNGGSCEESDNEQSRLWECHDKPFGDPEIGSETYFVIKDVFGFQTFFEGYLQVGEEFTMKHPDGQQKNLAANTNVTIYNSSDVDGKNIVQSQVIHTSCSRDLHLNDIFGSLQLKEFYNDVHGEVRCLYMPVDDSAYYY